MSQQPVNAMEGIYRTWGERMARTLGMDVEVIRDMHLAWGQAATEPEGVSHEMMRDDAVRFAEKARAAGVHEELELVPGMQHVFQFMAGNSPKADESIRSMGAFLGRHLGVRSPDTPQSSIQQDREEVSNNV